MSSARHSGVLGHVSFFYRDGHYLYGSVAQLSRTRGIGGTGEPVGAQSSKSPLRRGRDEAAGRASSPCALRE